MFIQISFKKKKYSHASLPKNLVPEFTSLNSIYRQTQRHSQIIHVSISKFLMNHFLNSAAIKCILSVLNMYKEYIEIFWSFRFTIIHLDLLNFLFTLVTKNRLWHPSSLRHSSGPPSLSGKNDMIKSWISSLVSLVNHWNRD